MDLQKRKHQYLKKWLNHLKSEHKINGSEAAKALDVSQPYISQMLTGKRTITDSFINDFYTKFKDYGVVSITAPAEIKAYDNLSLEDLDGIADRMLNDIIELKNYIKNSKKNGK